MERRIEVAHDGEWDGRCYMGVIGTAIINPIVHVQPTSFSHVQDNWIAGALVIQFLALIVSEITTKIKQDRSRWVIDWYIGRDWKKNIA